MLHLMRGPQTPRNKICDIRKNMRKIEERETGISKFCRFVEEEKCLVSPRPCMTLIYSCTSVPKNTVSSLFLSLSLSLSLFSLSLSVPYLAVELSRVSDYLVWNDEDILTESLQHLQFDLLESQQASKRIAPSSCYFSTLILQIDLSFAPSGSFLRLMYLLLSPV